jgi:Nodulation protein Z (NodZ)
MQCYEHLMNYLARCCFRTKLIPTGALRAILDALRAFRVVPVRFARNQYALQEPVGWQLVSRRRYTLIERYRRKLSQAFQTLVQSWSLSQARSVIIPILSTEGLLSNLLHALEVLQRIRSDAQVYVDWTLSGTEKGFRYGRVGENVWDSLFRPLGAAPANSSWYASASLDFAFWGRGKDHLTGVALQRQRNGYHNTLSIWIEVTNTRVQKEIENCYGNTFQGRFCIGVHRRVGNALVANCQQDGEVPPVGRFIQCIQAEIRASGTEDPVIFLATDDAEAIACFRDAFGDLLHVRDQVQRTTAFETEVHYRNWGQLSITDAEDVLIDTLLLARCNVLVHASSSVSTIASLWNPDLRMIRVGVLV